MKDDKRPPFIDLHESEKPAGSLPLGDAILYILIGVPLTYFFFEPGKEAISDFLKSLLH